MIWRYMEIYGDETVPFPETLNYTLNLAYQENLGMSGDKVCSPDLESAPIATYCPYPASIQTAQTTLFVHVCIHLWPLKKNSSSKTLPAHKRMLLILISNSRAGERRK